MKKGRRFGAAVIAMITVITSINWTVFDVKADSNTDYNGAKVKSTGLVSNAFAVVKGENAAIVNDAAKNSNVLKLSGGEFGSGYLELPADMYEGVTDGFTISMDVNISSDAKNYGRLFQSSSVKLGTGSTAWWDAPDISVDLCDFNSFRSTVFVGDVVNTEDDGAHRSTFNWGSGAKKNEWKRLVMTVTASKVIMYYDGAEYVTSAKAEVLENLFEGDILKKYTYNAIGKSVYSSDEDVAAMYDNIAVYKYALNKNQATALSMPADYTFFWDFDNEDIELNNSEEVNDSLNVYTDGTELIKVTEVTSSNQEVTAYIYTDSATGRYFYSVAKDGKAVLNASLLGVTTENVDLSSNLTLADNSINVSEEGSYKELTFELLRDNGTVAIIMRVYDDCVAYRYVIEENGNTAGVITSEASEIVLPNDSTVWSSEPSDTYEGTYKKRSMSTIKNGDIQMSTPLLAAIENDEYFVLVTEASVFNVKEPYCASIFETASDEKNIKWIFGRKQDDTVSVSYPFTTPWRVAVIADDINELAGSNVLERLNPKADESIDWSFVKPGKVAWSWWSSSYDAIQPQTQKDYIDFAAENGWEYVLVDYGWELWDDYRNKIKDIVDYGKEKGIGVFIWYGVDKYDGKHIFSLNNRATMDEEFAWCQEVGVAGVKVDYINNDSQEAMKILYDLADSSAEHKLMMVYHGCTNPNGEEYTYPNIISYEAVRGAEYYKWGIGADIETLLTYPYTRNVLGSMDFTPTAYPLTTLDVTAGFAAAQTVVYQSYIQHFAHSAYIYEGSKVLSFLNDVPTVWDDSIYGGYPGDYNWVARNSGDDWYVGAMTADAREIEISLDFLKADKEYTAYIYGDNEDGKDLVVDIVKVSADEKLNLKLLKNGGAAVKITENEMNTITSYEKDYTYYEAENAVIGGNCKKETNNYASGLVSVGWVGNGENNHILFDNIEVDESGEYELKIFFITGEKRDIYVSVNGEEPICIKDLLSYSNDWLAVGRTSITINLKEGVNTVRVFNENGYAPSVDRIAVSNECVGNIGGDDNILSGEDNVPNTGDNVLKIICICTVFIMISVALVILMHNRKKEA